jgi:SagB-type dehydrogenase family enzyme
MKIRSLSLKSALFIILVLLMPGCGIPDAKENPAQVLYPSTNSTTTTTQGDTNAVATPILPLEGTNIKLPEPRLKSEVSLEEALYQRRSIRQYSDVPLKLSDVSQLLWAAQGITDSGKGGRTAPSAVAIYPLEIYLVAGNVEGLSPGIYRYIPEGHELQKIKDGDARGDLGTQATIKKAAIDIVIVANYKKVPERFGANSTKWVYLEGGHVAQNICLQVTALNLGTVTVGGFAEEQVKSLLGIPADMGVLYVLPVGNKP